MTDFEQLRQEFYSGKINEVEAQLRQIIAAEGYNQAAVALLLRVETAQGNAETVTRLGSQLMRQNPSDVTALLTSFGFDSAGDEQSAYRMLEIASTMPVEMPKVLHEKSRWDLLNEVKNLSSTPLDDREPGARGKVNIITILFDEKMTALARDFMLPSLYTNCKDLIDHYEVTQYIFTTQKDLLTLAPALKDVEKAGITVHVDTQLIDDILTRPGHASTYLHEPYKRIFQLSYENSIPVVIAPPDHFFGFGLENQLQRLPKGGMIVAGHPRLDWNDAPDHLKTWLETNQEKSNRSLVDLALHKAPHLMIRFGFENKNPYWHGSLSDTKASVYFKEPPPLLIDPVPDLIALMDERSFIGPYQTLDHDMVEYTFRRERLAWVDHSDDFFWCELTSPDQYNPTFINLYLTRSSRHFQNLELTWTFA